MQLGFWQLHRLELRLAENQVITKHFRAAPVALESVLKPGDKQTIHQQWTRILATGTYDVRRQVTVRFSTRDGAPGADIITPLVLDSGVAILVDRGWLQTVNNSAQPTNVPAPSSGVVTVEGWLRANSGANGQAVTPADGQVRAISSTGMASYVPYVLYDGYLNLQNEKPAAAGKLDAEPKPELGQGPHFFYALQWWFFAALATFGWFYFAWVEERERRKSVALSRHRDALESTT